MITKLDLIPQRAERPITEPVTKFGGQPVWLEHPAWPLDRGTGQPMALAPALALGGVERVDNVVRLPAVSVMTIQGDIATEMRRVTRDYTVNGEVTRVVPYTDEAGRSRLRVEFEEFGPEG